MSDFRPTSYYYELYKKSEEAGRPLASDFEDREGWAKWRRALRRKLRDLLGLSYVARFSPAQSPSQVLASLNVSSERDMGAYTLQRIVFTGPSTPIPAYLLKPKEPNGAGVLALHGHGRGKDEVVGLEPNGRPSPDPGYQKAFAAELAKRGFTVLAIDQIGFGERREAEDVAKGPAQSSCWQLSTWALMFGETAVGRRVLDAAASVELLKALMKKGKVGVMGISGGGTVALYLSALFDGVDATVVSGYLNTYERSILSIKHCIDNYVPGLLKYAEQYDVASLIAPRPLFFEHGEADPIFPIEAFRLAYERVRRVYELLGAGERLEAHAFKGGHEINGSRAYPFLEKWLAGSGSGPARPARVNGSHCSIWRPSAGPNRFGLGVSGVGPP